MVLQAGGIPKPVAVARLLMEAGLGLRKAHSLLERLTKGERCAVEIVVNDVAAVVAALSEHGVDAAPIRRPVVSARRIRQDLDLSQSEFAVRFGLEVRTVQNWEQERNQLDPAATILLALIRDDPAAVERVLLREPSR